MTFSKATRFDAFLKIQMSSRIDMKGLEFPFIKNTANFKCPKVCWDSETEIFDILRNLLCQNEFLLISTWIFLTKLRSYWDKEYF